MKFEIIRDTRDMEMYRDVPCLPVEYDATQGERYIEEVWRFLNYLRLNACMN